jgi:hypothetical protein
MYELNMRRVRAIAAWIIANDPEIASLVVEGNPSWATMEELRSRVCANRQPIILTTPGDYTR